MERNSPGQKVVFWNSCGLPQEIREIFPMDQVTLHWKECQSSSQLTTYLTLSVFLKFLGLYSFILLVTLPHMIAMSIGWPVAWHVRIILPPCSMA